MLSEESKQLPYETRSRWNSYWLVDPLDGTKEFLSRNGEFTVNIALIDPGHPARWLYDDLAVYVRNLADKVYHISGYALGASAGVNTWYPGEPRTIGGELSVKF